MKIRLDGVVGWDILAADIADKLEGANDVHLILNSSGGSILEGLSIYEMLEAHEGRVTVQVDFAASMASVIAMAGDEIIMNEKTSLMMIHRPWSGTVGDADEMRKTADTLDKWKECFRRFILIGLGICLILILFLICLMRKRG